MILPLLAGLVLAPLVKLNVVAVDAGGRIIADLKREDFQVFDGGKPQQIVSFRRNEVKPLRVLPPKSSEVSNRSGASPSHATVILFDLLNARMEDRGYAVSRLIPALQHVEASESLFLYVLTMNGTIYPVHAIPDPDASALPNATNWTDEIKPLLDAAMRKLGGLRPLNLTVDERVHTTYGALGALASRVADIPGRKSLIWISHGMPISIGGGRSGGVGEIDYTPLLQRLTSTLDRANVAVYTVRQPGSLAPGSAVGPTAGMGSTETLEQFAGLTGGRAYGTVDIEGAIAQAATDNRLSYSIAFEPPLGGWDGKYHKIRVSCARKGVRLQTKQGYYAFAADAHEGDQEKASIQSAVSSPFDVAEIGLYSGLTPTGKSPGEFRLDVRIDAGDLELARDGDVFTGQLAVGFIAYLAEGGAEASPLRTYAPRVTAEQVREGITMMRMATLPENVRKIRVVVLDRTTGAVGSLTVAVPGK